MSIEENLNLMKTLDDLWNAQDWQTFRKRHAKTAWSTGRTSRQPKASICARTGRGRDVQDLPR